MIIWSLVMMVFLTGCAAVPQGRNGANKQLLLRDIERAAMQNELYRAEQLTKAALKKYPHDEEFEKIMAQLLDHEIAREKSIFGQSKPPEDLEAKQKSSEAQIWLDRAETLLSLRQYDQALLAAEKVFLYAPDNIKASHLVDKIKDRAYQEGKSDTLYLKKMAEDEIRERIEKYREQAEQWIQQGRWGAAKLTVEKILLLVPEDQEALQLYDEIRTQTENQFEKRKAL